MIKEASTVVKVRIEQNDLVAPDERGFLALHRLRVANTYADGSESRVYDYDAVTRRHLDAVVVLLVAEIKDHTCLCLRACLRPPLLLRRGAALPFSDVPSASLWELPAGLIENDDLGADGVRSRAAAETLEETGYRLDPVDFEILPGAPYPTPGVIPERMHFTLARVPDAAIREHAAGDGSPAEDGAAVWWLPIDEALEAADCGELLDMKTELGVRRLAALLASRQKAGVSASAR